MIFILTAGADTHHLTNISTFDFHTQEKQTNYCKCSSNIFHLDHYDHLNHDEHLDHDDFLDHDDHLNNDDHRIWKEVGGCTKQVGGFLIPYNLQLACVRQGFS